MQPQDPLMEIIEGMCCHSFSNRLQQKSRGRMMTLVHLPRQQALWFLGRSVSHKQYKLASDVLHAANDTISHDEAETKPKQFRGGNSAMWRSKSGLAHHDDSYSRPFTSTTPCCLLLLACALSHGSGMSWQSTFTEKSTVFRRLRQALKATMKHITSQLEQWNSWWENQTLRFPIVKETFLTIC